MKKLIILSILFALVLAGCAPQNTTQIATTTLPVFEFTTTLCKGTGITVSRLVTENVSCLHDYSLQVEQMQAVEAAEAVIINGAGLEGFLEDVLINVDYVIDASENIPLSCGQHHEEDTHHHEQDPHIWLSPEKAKKMCQNIASKLSALYPQHANTFSTNLDNLLAKLDALQTYGEQALGNLNCRNLITFHDGFSYLAESFDLHILKAVEEESGSEASAKELIKLIDLVNNNHLPAIFTEANGSTAAAEIIAKETGVKIYTLDMAMAGDSYFTAMYHNINTVKEALE